MSLHIEYECIYVFVLIKVFLFILLVREAVDLDDPLVFRFLSITLILINGSYFVYTV